MTRGRPPKRTGKEPFNVWLDPEKKKALSVLASIAGMSLTDFIEQIANDYVAQHAKIQLSDFSETLEDTPRPFAPRLRQARKKKAA